MRKILAAALSLTTPAFALDVRFDQGVDSGAALRAAAAVPAPSAAAGKAAGSGRHVDWMSSSEMFSLEPRENESRLFDLSSIEVLEVCDASRCHREFGRTVRRMAKVVLIDRPETNPTETFEVWLTGEELSVKVIQSPTQYDSEVRGATVYLTARQ